MDKRFQILPDIYKQITNEIHDNIVRDNRRNVLRLLKGKWFFALSFTELLKNNLFNLSLYASS